MKVMRQALLGGFALLMVGGATADAQSLADVARQEAERRKTIGAPGKVYTNDSLRTEPAPAPPAETPAAPDAAIPDAAPETPAAGTPATTAPQTEADWRKRVAAARDNLARLQTFSEALQTRINALTADFTSRDDPAQRQVVAADRQKAMAELDRVKQEIADQQKAIAALQDEARKAGVPAGWVR
jgi:hypothetical protein